MSKAFDKVWHQGLIYKLGPVGISGEALAFISSYFNNRFHHIILTGQSSNRLPVKVGVLQGSNLGSLFFLVYVNDLTSLFSVANDANISTNELHKDLELISEWHTKRKCLLLLTRINRHKKLFSHENNLSHNILSHYLIRHLLRVLPLKSTLR